MLAHAGLKLHCGEITSPSNHLEQQQSSLLRKLRRATAHQRGSVLGEMLKILAGMSSPLGKWLGRKGHTAHGLTVVKDQKGFKRQSRVPVFLRSVLFLCHCFVGTRRGEPEHTHHTTEKPKFT